MADENKIIDLSALERFKNNARKNVAPKTFSVPASAWTASSDTDFAFKAEIVVSGITAADSADVRFDNVSIKAAGAAGVITGETAAGKITLFAEKAPTIVLSGVYVISKGAV